MQLVYVGASNIQIRRNGTVQRYCGIRFCVEIMRRILLTVYYMECIRILPALIRILTNRRILSTVIYGMYALHCVYIHYIQLIIYDIYN